MMKKIVAVMVTGCMAVSMAGACFAMNLEIPSPTVGNMVGSDNIAPASSGNVIALDDLNISVVADDYVSGKQDDGFVYLYTMNDDSMPYVIIGEYDHDFSGFADDFTAYMASEYDDLDVNSLEEGIDIGGMTFDKVTYEYSVGEYTVNDTRLFTELNGKVYMFGSKEVPQLGYTLSDGYLEGVASSVSMLAGGYGDYDLHVYSEESIGASGDVSAADDVSSSIDTGAGSTDSGMSIGAQSPLSAADVGTAMGAAAGSLPIPSQASETDAVSSSGGMVFDESMAGYQGTWCPFVDGFQFYLPSDWVMFSVPEDQKAGGCIYQAGPEVAQTDTTAPHVAVNCVDVSGYGYSTMDDLKNDLIASGYEVEEVTSVNGIDCVSYSYANPDLRGLMFYGPNDSNYVFALIVYNYGLHKDILAPALCSLKKYVG